MTSLSVFSPEKHTSISKTTLTLEIQAPIIVQYFLTSTKVSENNLGKKNQRKISISDL